VGLLEVDNAAGVSEFLAVVLGDTVSEVEI
jgi:hypothetical protein